MAIEAADKLQHEGIHVDLLNISTLKPLDADTIINSVSKTGKMLTIEEHSIIGGLGSACAEVVGKHNPVKIDFIGINDTFTETGPYSDLLAKYGISVKAIIEKVKQMVVK